VSAVKDPELLSSPQGGQAGRLFDPGGGRTLDDLVTALGDNALEHTTTCPVCLERALAVSDERVLECAACGSRIE
jgi:ribosomal protein L37AE/L43A